MPLCTPIRENVKKHIFLQGAVDANETVVYIGFCDFVKGTFYYKSIFDIYK